MKTAEERKITVKKKDGQIATYYQPSKCCLPYWSNPLGYCWAYANAQDEDDLQKFIKNECKNCEYYLIKTKKGEY